MNASLSFCCCCSLAAHKLNPNTDMHFYGATKVMLLAMQEGIRQELREMNTNIRISVSIFFFFFFIVWILFFLICQANAPLISIALSCCCCCCWWWWWWWGGGGGGGILMQATKCIPTETSRQVEKTRVCSAKKQK